MDTSIVVALITTGGVVLAAIIGLMKKSKATKDIKISQKNKGNNNTNIGIQNIHNGDNE